MQQILAARGRPVYASDGGAVGVLDAVYYDRVTREPEWLRVVTSDGAPALVPLYRTEVDGDGVRVPWPSDRIVSAPTAGGDEIPPDVERFAYAHYGISEEEVVGVAEYEEREPRDHDRVEITRSEEELVVDKKVVEHGRVRLRKWVESEPVAVDVELAREAVRIVREPVNAYVGLHEFRNEDIDIPVHAEEPVVRKDVVAKEQIVVDRELEADRTTIREEIRKERVEVEEEQ